MKHPLHTTTPLILSEPLSSKLEVPVWLKMEALQPTGSFKIRGIGLLCQTRVKEGIRHLVASSGGNAGLAVAYAGRQLGVKVTVVIPEPTPRLMIEKIESLGATVLVHGQFWAESHEYAQTLGRATQAAYIHPFDDPLIWEGHSTMIEEVAQELTDSPGAVLVAVGGGGLICGVLEGLHQVRWNNVPVYAIETEGAASLNAAFKAGQVVKLEKIDTVAKSLGAPWVTDKVLEWKTLHEIVPWVVPDRAAVHACLRFAEDHRILVEPACGAALSLAYDCIEPLRRVKSLVVIVCGGVGVSLELLNEWKVRFSA